MAGDGAGESRSSKPFDVAGRGVETRSCQCRIDGTGWRARRETCMAVAFSQRVRSGKHYDGRAWGSDVGGTWPRRISNAVS